MTTQDNNEAASAPEQYWEEQPDGTITPVDPVDMAGGAGQSSAAINDSEDARAYLVGWMRDNFLSDKTFAPYIFKELAGDFAYQLARALAHVARQRQESPGKLDFTDYSTPVKYSNGTATPSAAVAEGVEVDTPALRKLLRNYYDTASSFAGSSPSESALQAVFRNLETVYGAQQREAGRRDMHETNMALLNENCALKERLAALSRQPVSEGLTDEQITEGLKLHRLTHDKPSQLADGFRSGARWAERSLSAAPPAKAEGMSDEDRIAIEQAADALDESHPNKAEQLRAILAASSSDSGGEKDKRDAERYRGLRDSGEFNASVTGKGWAITTNRTATDEEMDAAADAILAQQAKGASNA